MTLQKMSKQGASTTENLFFFLPAFLLKEGISLELAHIQFQLQEGCALQRKGFCQLPHHRELSR